MPVDEPAYPREKAGYTRDIELTGESVLYRIWRAKVGHLGEAAESTCVIKVLDLERPNTSAVGSDTLSDVQKEVEVMRGCSHRNIVHLHTSFACESEVCLAFQ